MLALYRCGRQAEALDVYRKGRRLLADELGLEPAEELRRLEKAILEQDESLATPAAQSAALPGAFRRERRGLRLVAIVAGALLLTAALVAAIVLSTRGSAAIVVRPNSVAALDAKTGKVVADIPIGGRPVAIALGAGAVWVADADNSTVSRIDAETKERLSIGGLGSDVSDLAFGFGALWVAGGNDGTLARVDPRHNGIEPVSLGEASAGLPQPLFVVRTGAGAVWVTRGNELLRVDPREERVTARLPVPRTEGLAVGLGSVWLTTQDERVMRIDARRAEPLYARDLSQLGFFPLVAEGSLWVIGSPGLRGDRTKVWRLNPGTFTQDATIALPKVPAYGLAAGNGALWTVDPDSGGIWRIDAQTNTPTRLATVGHHPIAVAAGGGVVWVGVQDEPLG
jgi:streptogramin lyase